jgi:hypothetical protein
MLAPQTLVDKLKEPIAQARTKQCHRFGYGLEILTIDNQAQEASTDAIGYVMDLSWSAILTMLGQGVSRHLFSSPGSDAF